MGLIERRRTLLFMQRSAYDWKMVKYVNMCAKSVLTKTETHSLLFCFIHHYVFNIRKGKQPRNFNEGRWIIIWLDFELSSVIAFWLGILLFFVIKCGKKRLALPCHLFHCFLWWMSCTVFCIWAMLDHEHNHRVMILSNYVISAPLW